MIAFRNPERRPTHPAAVLREDVLPAMERPLDDVAQALDMPVEDLEKLLAEQRPVTDAIAVRLGRLFGTSADVWFRM